MSQNFDLGKILDSCCNKRKQDGDFLTTEKKKKSFCQLKNNFENICFLEKCCKREIKSIEEIYPVRISFNSDKESSYISIEQSGSDTFLMSEIESEINDLIEQKIQDKFLFSPIHGSSYLVVSQSFIKVIQDLENQNLAIVTYNLNHKQDAWNYEKTEAEINSIIFRIICTKSNDINLIKKRAIEALSSLITCEEITDIDEPKLSSLQEEDIWDLRNKFPQFDIKWKNKHIIIIHGPKYDKIYLTSYLREKIIDRLIKDQSNVPFYWESVNSAQSNKYDDFLFELECTSQEFISIAAYLNANLNNRVKNLYIYRNQNYNLYQMYFHYKKKLEFASQDANEMNLFHGTDEEIVFKICKNGFNRSFCGKNGIAFGQGVYFSTTSSYAKKYSKKEKKCIIKAKVAVGKSCIGNSSMKIPNEQYNSTCNEERNIFVCYHDNQCYPDYVICFEEEEVKYLKKKKKNLKKNLKKKV